MRTSAFTTALALAAALVAAAGSVSTASADPVAAAPGSGSALQQQIDQVLAENPGGTQTGPATVEWEGGAVELDLAAGVTGLAAKAGAATSSAVTLAAVGSCATGRYCVYNGTYLTGSKLSFSTCGTYSTGALPGSVRSIANARSSGYVQGRNSAGSTLTTVWAGGKNNVAPSGITQVRCVG